MEKRIKAKAGIKKTHFFFVRRSMKRSHFFSVQHVKLFAIKNRQIYFEGYKIANCMVNNRALCSETKKKVE